MLQRYLRFAMCYNVVERRGFYRKKRQREQKLIGLSGCIRGHKQCKSVPRRGNFTERGTETAADGDSYETGRSSAEGKYFGQSDVVSEIRNGNRNRMWREPIGHL
jgi:hypothetical protein